MTPIRVFIVDDEQPARRKLRRFVEEDGDAIVAGEAANGKDAVRGIRDGRPDLVLLDVQMKGMDGFDVVRGLDRDSLPRIVFVTAHDEYMLQAFDVHAFAYLLKPFDRGRFRKVLADVKEELARAHANRAGDLERLLAELERRRQAPQRFLIETNERAFFLAMDEIDWIEANRNNARVHAGDAVHVIRNTIDALERTLDAAQFIRVNRSTLVRIDFINELRKWFHGEYKIVLRSGVVVTWTRRYVGRRPDLLRARSTSVR
jgi:two-component system LytT family response regulator